MMAVKGSDKMNVLDDFYAEEGPLIFKRTIKRNQPLSEEKKSTSSLDGQTRRKTSDISSDKGQNSVVRKRKRISFIKTSPTKASIDISKPSTSYVNSNTSTRHEMPISALVKRPLDKISPLNPSVKKPKLSDPVSSTKIERVPLKHESKFDDDNDHIPISQRLAKPIAGSSKRPLDKTSSLNPSVKKSKLSDLASSTEIERALVRHELKVDDGDDHIPILQRLVKPITGSFKRPVDKTSFLNPSLKKPKLSDPASLTKIERVPVKHKSKVDDNDDRNLISQRLAKSSIPGDKSLFVKKIEKAIKVNKSSPASFKKQVKKINKSGSNSGYSISTKVLPSGGDGQKKWTTLVRNGVIFPPPYKPHRLKILYKGKPINLTPEQEEVATMSAVMRDTNYALKEKFKTNIWSEWHKLLGKNHVIQNLTDCDFTPIYDGYQVEKEKKKQMSTKEKKALKEKKDKQEVKYMWAIVDSVKEKVENFRVEPPGLFRGHGEHPIIQTSN